MKIVSLLATLLLAAPAFAAPAPAAAAAVDFSGLEKRAPVSVTYDDKFDPSSNVVYPDGWTHLTNQGFGTYQKTLSYTGRQGEVFVYLPGSSRIPNPDRRYAIKLWSTLKSDRGRVNIYCGSTNIGAASQYSSGGETTSRVFWSGSNIRCDPAYIVLKNDGGAAYMAFDRIDITYT